MLMAGVYRVLVVPFLMTVLADLSAGRIAIMGAD